MSESPEDLVLESRDGHVVTLTLHLPERLNAMTQAMGEAFQARVVGLAQDPDLRAVVLTGHGRAFSAGGDLGMIGGRADQGAAAPGVARLRIRDQMRSFYKLFLSVRDLPCPTVAAINGHAIGAGFCVALACDLRVVAEDAKVGLNFTRLGLHPGMAATWTVPRIVGPALAAELLYTGRIILGAEAARLGLVNRAVEREKVLSTALELAQEIAGSAPVAVRAVKRALRRSADVSLEDQLSFEATEQAACFETADVREGLTAARERREPRFRGR
ncbi:MAG: enoyl-CoA hydratase/isomerase family protein [Proteobacteria bacterium]|nr:enoyl-CoA hydratase/isomerase family protein [Pseudomonadota bacterium]MCZ6781788.1 enoyl-CoA hydratase/isomerase family protein [Pseudomonadota bacterium]